MEMVAAGSLRRFHRERKLHLHEHRRRRRQRQQQRRWKPQVPGNARATELCLRGHPQRLRQGEGGDGNDASE